MHYIIVLADGWGYTCGGINVFNKLLCEGLAKEANENIKVICAAPNIDLRTVDAAKKNNLFLVNLSEADLKDPEKLTSKITEEYDITANDVVDWIGHDTYTDEIALKCRDEIPQSRCSIIHHMAYGKYYPLLNRDTKVTEEKEKHQKNALKKSDFVFANGPVLTKNAQDIVGSKEKVIKIYPGISEVKGARKYINNDFSVVTFGRVEPEKGLKRNNSIIKQVYLAVAAWAKFAETFLGSDEDTVMKVYGKNEDTTSDNELEDIFSKYSKSAYALSSIAYEKDRDVLLNDLADFSVCLVLSLREGFGMTALEAVSAGVPLIVSEKSGFFEMLRENHLESYVYGVDIQGSLNEPYFSDEDLNTVTKALYAIFKNQEKAKKDVFELRDKLKDKDLTWENCARKILETLYTEDDELEELYVEEEDFFALRPFSETYGKYDSLNPIVSLLTGGDAANVVCLSEHVNVSVRQGAVGEHDIEECLEYIKLANYYNEKLPERHRFKVRWMFLEKINPSHAVGIEYLYHQEEEPIYSEDEIKEMFHDECELRCGIINVVQVKITSVDMKSDYFFEDGPAYDTLDGFR